MAVVFMVFMPPASGFLGQGMRKGVCVPGYFVVVVKTVRKYPHVNWNSDKRV